MRQIIFDGIKWWYISDPQKFPDNSKLTFHYSEKAAFREFNGKNRIFTIFNSKLDWIKVSYYWVIKPHNKIKGPYFHIVNDEEVFYSPRKIKEKIKKLQE